MDSVLDGVHDIDDGSQGHAICLNMFEHVDLLWLDDSFFM